MSRHALLQKVVISRTNGKSFRGGADYPMHWVSVLVEKIIEREIPPFIFVSGPLG